MTIKETLQSALQGAGSLWSSRQRPSGQSQKRDYEDIRKVNAALLPLLFVGFVGAIGVGWTAGSVGPVLLWCVACLAVGATVGFLFGIPRSGVQVVRQNGTKNTPKAAAGGSAASTEHENETGRPNTNLEEVSDWLTKILVGLSLVHLKTIEEKVMAISRNAASALNDTPTAADISAATALVVGFAVIGFLCGYLYTRLFLQGAFSRSNQDMRRFQDTVAEELARPSVEAAPPAGEPSVPSAADRQSAERVLQVAPLDRPDEVLLPLRALAAEYEGLRRELPFGRERTGKMSEIANRMKRVALVAVPFLHQLTQSASPGQRLAAVMVLQMKFDPAYIEWLADRLVDEPAFVGYQAASALLARMRVVGEPERKRIKKAVQAAMQKRQGLGLEAEEQRDKLVEEILAT